MSNIFTDFPFLAALVAFILFTNITFGLWQLKKVKNFIKGALESRATVKDFIFIKDGKHSYHEVTVEFKTNNSQTITAKSRATKKYSKNDTIDILYSKSDPNDFKIKDFQHLYLLPFLFIVVQPICVVGIISIIFLSGAL